MGQNTIRISGGGRGMGHGSLGTGRQAGGGIGSPKKGRQAWEILLPPPRKGRQGVSPPPPSQRSHHPGTQGRGPGRGKGSAEGSNPQKAVWQAPRGNSSKGSGEGKAGGEGRAGKVLGKEEGKKTREEG